jgi:hypothetical protein
MISTDIAEFRRDLQLVRDSANAVVPLGYSPATVSTTGVLSSALIVLLSGRFESFLKAVMRSFIEEVNSSYVPFDRLPLNLQLTHFRQGARVLQEAVAQARKSGDFTVLLDLSKRLASVASNPFEASWEAFTNTSANPGPDTVKELANNLGLLDVWSVLSGRPRVAGRGDLKLFLSNFIEIRNECAHTGASTAPLSPSDILAYADSLEIIAEEFSAVLIEYGAQCVAA